MDSKQDRSRSLCILDLDHAMRAYLVMRLGKWLQRGPYCSTPRDLNYLISRKQIRNFLGLLIIPLKIVQSKIKDDDKNPCNNHKACDGGGGGGGRLGNEVTEYLISSPTSISTSCNLQRPAATTLNFGEIWAVLGMRIGNHFPRVVMWGGGIVPRSGRG